MSGRMSLGIRIPRDGDVLQLATLVKNISHMSQDRLIKLSCTVCKRTNYWSEKNKKKVERKIELKKFCEWCMKRTTHKESKK